MSSLRSPSSESALSGWPSTWSSCHGPLYLCLSFSHCHHPAAPTAAAGAGFSVAPTCRDALASGEPGQAASQLDTTSHSQLLFWHETTEMEIQFYKVQVTDNEDVNDAYENFI